MSTAFNSIKRGLLEAIELADGRAPQTLIHRPREGLGSGLAIQKVGFGDSSDLKLMDNLPVSFILKPE